MGWERQPTDIGVMGWGASLPLSRPQFTLLYSKVVYETRFLQLCPY